MNKKINNTQKANNHLNDYFVSKNYNKNGIKTDIDENYVPNNYNYNEVYYNNKNNSIKIDFDFDEDNIFSKSSNNYNSIYSNSLINKKYNKNSMINNNKINKGLKESKDQIDQFKKEINALKYYDKIEDIYKYNHINSKTKSKQKYQNTFNNNYINNNTNKGRNKSNKPNNNIYNNNDFIYNIGKYNKNNIHTIKNIEEEYNNYLYNKNENIILNNTNSYKNIAKKNNYLSEALNKKEYIPNNHNQNDEYRNYIYDKRNKNINFNNINIGINNNNFIIDNNKAYQTYQDSFEPNTIKFDMDDNINNNNNTYKNKEIIRQNMLKDKNKKSKSLNKRNDFYMGKFIIETENDQNIVKNRNKSIKNDNNANNLNTNYFYNSNSHTLDGKNSKYNISLSKKNYSIPLYYSQNLKEKNNNFVTNSNNKEVKNYLKNEKKLNTYSDGNIFNKTESSKKANNSNKNSDKKSDKNSEFFYYNDRLNNFNSDIISFRNSKNDNTKINPINKNTKNNKNHYNTNSISQRNNIYEKDNNNQLYISKNNFIKSERNIINNNINKKQVKNYNIEYKSKLENIKVRMKDLLNIYNFLLRNKINFNIENYKRRNDNNNNNGNQ